MAQLCSINTAYVLLLCSGHFFFISSILILFHSMNILPLTAPGRPTDLDGKAQNGNSVQLRWSKPNDPNGVILGYQVFYYGYKGNHTKVKKLIFGIYLVKVIVISIH